jgi:hypothetical protein
MTFGAALSQLTPGRLSRSYGYIRNRVEGLSRDFQGTQEKR